MGICWGNPTLKSTELQLPLISYEEEASVRDTNVNPFGGLLSAECSNVRKFSFAELKAATSNFGSESLIGSGKFGNVYKGLINEQKVPPTYRSRKTLVAVKKLCEGHTQEWKIKFQKEVILLGSLQHPNIVNLLGYCIKGSQLLLVYEYAAKGCFTQHIFDRGSIAHPLTWDKRLRIMIDIARGLVFLHTLEKKNFFGAIKPSNILLDEAYNAKLDFGLAWYGPENVMTRINGFGYYLAPEVLLTGHFDVKTDVYSFGILLLEILTGLPGLDRKRPEEKRFLLRWATPRLSSIQEVIAMSDTKAHYPCDVAFKIAELIIQCTITYKPSKRPSMTQVLMALENIETTTANLKIT